MKSNNKKFFLSFFTTFILGSTFLLSQAHAEGSHKLSTIGVQLYSLRTEAENGVEAVLKNVSAMGYQQVELHTLYDMSAAELRKLLDKYDLKAPSTHRGFKLIKEDVNGTIADAKALGLDLVIVPWLDIKEYNTKEKWVAFASELNTVGKKLKESGIRLAYHNHDFEFKALKDGSIPYDVLLANTNPQYVSLQLDLFWIIKAGKDPLAYMKANSGRIVSVHVKDMTADGEMTEVGAGKIDFAKIFKVGHHNGLQYFIVEHDKPAKPLASVETSIKYLRKLEY